MAESVYLTSLDLETTDLSTFNGRFVQMGACVFRELFYCAFVVLREKEQIRLTKERLENFFEQSTNQVPEHECVSKHE